MGSDGGYEECCGFDPTLYEGGVHAVFGGDFAIPIAIRLELVESEFESVFVVGASLKSKRWA